MSQRRGDPILFEFSSANATTAAVVTLRDAGTGTTRILLATERVVINTIVAVVASGAVSAMIFNDANANGTVDSGERLVPLGTGIINVASAEGPDGGFAGSLGITPKVKAANAGQIDITGTGYIMNT